MITFSLSEAATHLQAELYGVDCPVQAVSTNSQSCQNALFVALVGERFDAHDFAQSALENGAVALLVNKKLNLDIPQLVVADTTLALGLLGQLVFKKSGAKAISITGSSGKTTVKEMLHAIVAVKFDCFATKGNLNNHIGVPLTLLEAQTHHQVAIIEHGANHVGEIAYSTQFVQPNIAMVNNVARAHIEGFGGIENTAKAKSEIYQHLQSDGVAVINLDDNFAKVMLEKSRASEQIGFSVNHHPDAIVQADAIIETPHAIEFTLTIQGDSAQVSLPMLGRHQVSNALAAASCAFALGMQLDDIVTGLMQVKAPRGRMNRYSAGHINMIDDSYNANPESVKAAIDWLATQDGTKVLAIGSLAELGAESKLMHQELGLYAKAKGIDIIASKGELGASCNQDERDKNFSDSQELARWLTQLIQQYQPINILVKGSRSSKMEQVCDALINAHTLEEV